MIPRFDPSFFANRNRAAPAPAASLQAFTPDDGELDAPDILSDLHPDRLEGVCPVLRRLASGLHDSIEDPRRRRRVMVPFLSRLVGTRSTPAVEARRAELAFDWIMRQALPEFLRLHRPFVPFGKVAGAVELLRAMIDVTDVPEFGPQDLLAGFTVAHNQHSNRVTVRLNVAHVIRFDACPGVDPFPFAAVRVTDLLGLQRPREIDADTLAGIYDRVAMDSHAFGAAIQKAVDELADRLPMWHVFEMSEGRWIDGYMTCEEAGRVAEDLPAAEVFAGTRAAAEAAAMEWIKQRSGF